MLLCKNFQFTQKDLLCTSVCIFIPIFLSQYATTLLYLHKLNNLWVKFLSSIGSYTTVQLQNTNVFSSCVDN